LTLGEAIDYIIEFISLAFSLHGFFASFFHVILVFFV